MVASDLVSFGERVARMQRIQRGKESYGEGSPALQATAFYLDHMLSDAVERARAASTLPRKKVDLLISVCGFAATPTVLTFELLRPRQLLVLRSQDALESVNLIGRHLVVPGRLQFEQFHHEAVNPTDPMDMYVKIAAWLKGHEGQYAVIDITGGRKVMSAAAALAAWQLNLGLSYVENQFDPHTRQPLPGEDRLIMLDNPTTLFGEQEMGRALEMLRSGAFEAAHERYAEIAERVAMPGRARLMREVAELYRAWCDLEMPALAKVIDSMPAALRQARDISPATADTVRAQLAFARRLTGGDQTAFVVCFYILGLHYQQLRRHDFAALLFYRTVEACLTGRLRQRWPGFDPDNCDYTLLGDVAQIRHRYTTIGQALDPPTHAGLPGRMTLFAGAQLLAAVGDDLARRVGLVDAAGAADPARLTRLRDRALARNKSVLAHGTDTIPAEHTESLRLEAAEMLEAYWGLYGDGGDLGAFCDRLRFLRSDR